MQKGSSSLSLPWSPDPQTVDSRQSSAHYLEERELVFSKNGVCCIQGHVSLRGYLALHCRSGSGVTLSWTPVSVLRGLHTNNPDTDKEILVQLHNISILVHRRYPPEHAMCAGAPDGEGDMEEMVLVGVDGKQYPGFRFPSGGVSVGACPRARFEPCPHGVGVSADCRVLLADRHSWKQSGTTLRSKIAVNR
eukprot:m.62742 g.62742  ORF g.62742 m.62742 type:complete len:192 (+) comp17714_c0_seq4:23-598(+)